MNATSHRGPWAWIKSRFSFQGRATRREYWATAAGALVLFFVVAAVIIFCLQGAYFLIEAHGGSSRAVLDLILFLSALLLLLADFALYAWAVLAAAARRSHDIGRPFIGGVRDFFSLRGLTTRGTVGPNQYGPDPLQDTAIRE
jgi:uncharacterized membrane protein YhaH (DUF805 family)